MNKSTIADQIRGVGRELQNLFFPKNCLNCRKEGVWLCESCKDSLFFNSRFLASPKDPDSKVIKLNVCPFCRKKLVDSFCVCPVCHKETGIEKIFALFNYSDFLVRKIIMEYKYNYIQDIVRDLEPVIRKFLFKYNQFILKGENTEIIPIPLHWYKKCERGFNQAEALADTIGKILNLQVAKNIIFKIKGSRNQVEISHQERYTNLKGVFKISGTAPKNAIIVDDVFTTGSTVKEVAKVLRLGGSKNIQVITLAKG